MAARPWISRVAKQTKMMAGSISRITMAGLILLSCSAPKIVTAGPAPAKVAIVATAKGLEVDDLLSLAEAQLTDEHSLRLLERREVDRLLSEQALSLSGLVRTDAAVAAGKILRADVLAVVEAPSHKAVIIFDIVTGERLWDQALPDATEGGAKALAGAVAGAVGKRTAQERRSICITTVRNVDLPRARQGICDAVAAMTERLVLGSPGIAVLERSRLGRVTEEHHLTSGDAASHLHASLVLMELDFSHDPASPGHDAILAAATLTDVSHQPLAKVTALGSADDIDALAASLSREITKALAAPAPQAAAADRKVEASRFFRESRFQETHSEWTAAATAADAAYALDPSENGYLVQLAKTLVMKGVAHEWEGVQAWGIFPRPGLREESFVEALEQLQRATETLLPAGHMPGATVELRQAAETLHTFVISVVRRFPGNPYRAFDSGARVELALTRESGELFRRVTDNYERYAREYEEPAAHDLVNNLESLDAYTKVVERILGDSYHFFADDSHAYLADLGYLVPRWAPLAGKYDPKQRSTMSPTDTLMLGFYRDWEWRQVYHFYANTQWHERLHWSAADLDAWRPILEAVEKSKGMERYADNMRRWLNDYEALDGADTRPARIAQLPPAVPLPPRQTIVQSNKPPTIRPPTARVAATRPAAARPAERAAASSGVPLLYSDAHMLVDVEGPDRDTLREVCSATIDGDVLKVVAVTSSSEPAYVLLRVPIDGGPKQRMSSLRTIDPKIYGIGNCIATGQYVVGSGMQAIYVLPWGDGIARRIDVGEGLPTGEIQKVVEMEGTLYLFVGRNPSGTYLVTCDLKTGNLNTLASSRRKEKLSPFDDSAPMMVRYLIADQDRHRIIFLAYSFDWEPQQCGLWEYSAVKKSFRFLHQVAFKRAPGGGDYSVVGSEVEDGRFFLSTGTTAIMYDMNVDAVVHGFRTPGLPTPQGAWNSVLRTWMERYGEPSRGMSRGDGTISQRIGDCRVLKPLIQGADPRYIGTVKGKVLVMDKNSIWCITPAR